MKNIFLFVAFLLFSAVVSSQIQFSVGAGLNLNASHIPQNSPELSDFPSWKGLAEINLSNEKKPVGWRISAQFETVQWRERYFFQKETFEKNNLYYLNFIPQIEIRPSNWFGISAGGFLKILLANNYYDYINRREINSPFNEFKNYDLGPLGSIRFFGKNVNWGFNYHHGIINVSKDRFFEDLSGDKIPKKQFNRIFQWTVTVKI